MKGENYTILEEIRETMKVIMDSQQQLLRSINELKAEQRKLQEEIRMNNFVLNNIAMRSEILN